MNNSVPGSGNHSNFVKGFNMTLGIGCALLALPTLIILSIMVVGGIFVVLG